jgi:hypothetical protein
LDAEELLEIDDKSFKYLQNPSLPKSLNYSFVKQIFLNSNYRAKALYISEFKKMWTDMSLKDIFIETLAYDLVYLEYGY